MFFNRNPKSGNHTSRPIDISTADKWKVTQHVHVLDSLIHELQTLNMEPKEAVDKITCDILESEKH